AEDGIRDLTVTGVQTCALPIYAVAARLTPSNYRALARATFAEMVLAGYTCVGEFHYVHHDVDGSPYADPNAMGAAIIAAAADARSEERRVGKGCRSRWSTEDAG